MRIDTRARVAIGAILDVAIHGVSRPVRLADISTRQAVSQSYLEQLFKRLVHGGFLFSTRGPGGGYQLNRRLGLISVAEVIDAVDAAAPSQDLRQTAVRQEDDDAAITCELWSGLDEYLHDYLRTVSLASVLAGAVESADWREHEFVVVMLPRPPAARGGDAGHQVAP